MHGLAFDNYRVGIEEAIKSDPRASFGYVDMKKEYVGYPSVMYFEVVWYIYVADVWVPSDPGPNLVQFTVDEVQSVLLERADPGGIPPLIL
jgi:hypothetical protein